MDNIHWPAEWEKQESIWFSWPHRTDTWPTEKLITIQNSFAQIISITSRFQKTNINVSKNLHPQINKSLTSAQAEMDNIQLHDHPTNDVWCRDYGATFVITRPQSRKHKLTVVDWRFNSWGGKFPPWNLDKKIAKQMAIATQANHLKSNLYLEGGAIEGNGAGLLITTEAVALNPNRNPELTKTDIEEEFSRTLGTKKTFWLPSGIEGDDTDGHIDDLTRFVRDDIILNTIETNPTTPNYQTLQRNKEILQDLKTTTNSNVEIIDLHMPDPLRTKQWRLETLPASYANFLIINNAVIVPTFAQKRNDQQAIGILGELFSNRKIIGVDCTDIIWEGGAVHCISQQQPALE